jgi:proteic killer suppression protein
MAIRGCKDKNTQRFLAGERVRAFEGFADAAARALTKLQAVAVLADLLSPPSNLFEALEGDRNGQYSISTNKQYRLCFRWVQKSETAPGTDPLSIPGEPDEVEITDYH